jgi:Ca2+-binding RTX toxin-like protein
LTAKVTDAAGNTGPASAAVIVTIESAAASALASASSSDGSAESGVFAFRKAFGGMFSAIKEEATNTAHASVSYKLADWIEELNLMGQRSIDGTGNAQDNVIVGNDGDNVISGLAGADTLTGQGGADTFVFAAPSHGMDTITDFVPGVDTLQISASGFGGGLEANGDVTLVSAVSASAASQPGDGGYFIFDNSGPDAGTLLWDPTGGSGADAVAVVKLQNVTTLQQSDFQIV